MKIKKEIEINLPDIKFTKSQEEDFIKYVEEVIQKDGAVGLLIALEMYLGK